MASQRIRRPSASVLRISTVCPDIVRTMSPGLVAVPLGRFSQVGTTPTRLIGSFSSATACNTPSTVAAPHMSYFISSIAPAGLMEMPPESKVIPLPTSTTGLAPARPPRYCSTIKRGGSTEPCVTARKAPIRNLRISAVPSALSVSFFPCLTMPRARSTR